MTAIDASQVLARADRLIAVGVAVSGRGPRTTYLESTDVAEIQRWCESHILDTNKRVALIMSHNWETDHPEKAEAIVQVLRDREKQAAIAQVTTEHSSVGYAKHFIRNIRRLSEVPLASQLGQPLKGMTAVVVAAGPSLEKNRHLLKEAYGKAAVFAVNTSCGAVDSPLDAIFSVESKDVRSGLRRRRNECVHVLGLTANPLIWDVPHKGQVATINQHPPLTPYVLQLGAAPINYGCGVVACAVSTAYYWGAEQVVLVGQDLAWTGGQCYAQGTPFEDLSAKTVGGRLEYDGQSKTITPDLPVEVEAWGGGTVTTTAMWAGFIDWFASASRKVRLVNCTEGGARIPGTIEARLSDVLQGLPKTTRPNLRGEGSEAWRGVRARLRMEARAVLSASPREFPFVYPRCSMLPMWFVPAVSKLNTVGGLDSWARAAEIRKSIVLGAEEILEILEEESYAYRI